MKKILSILVLAFLSLNAAQAGLTPQASATSIAEISPIHPQNVTQLLKEAADHWNMSLGQARQAYNRSDLLLTQYFQAGDGVFMVTFDGGCILVQLEDVRF